jgi:hypothetical protein
MNPELVKFHLPTTDQFPVAVDTVGPFWAAQTLGVALNSEVVFVGGSAGPLLGPP